MCPIRTLPYLLQDFSGVLAVILSNAPITLCLCPGVVGFNLRIPISLDITKEINCFSFFQRYDRFESNLLAVDDNLILYNGTLSE